MPRARLSASGGPAAIGGVLRRTAENAAVLLRDAVAAPLASRVPRDWVGVRLDRGLVEAPATPPWLEAFRPGPRPLPAVLTALERAGRDPRVHGVLLRAGGAPLGWSVVSSLLRVVGELRERGKLAVVYAERTGNAGAWLGASADRFWMTPEGRLDLVGVRADSPYVREALDRLGIRPEVLHAGRYKAAAELLERSSMSEAARRALQSVVDDLYDALVGGLAAGRGADADEARRWIDEGPYVAAEALERGIVDALVYGDEVPERLAGLASGRSGLAPACDPAGAAAPGQRETPPQARLIPEPAYLRVSRPRFQWQPLARGRPNIAVVPIDGLLRSPERPARAVVAALRRLADLDRVRAAVLRVNSPGGDALAADLIWRAVSKLREVKPVVASLGDAAASGGYYVAIAANEIVAEPTTLTGSIGVVLAGLEFDPLLERLGIRFDGVERGRHAGIYDPYRRRSDEERELLRRQVQRLYREFVRKVAEGRGLEEEAAEKVAEGRVWTGAQALERGLIDALGGIGVALDRARALAGLAPGVGEPRYVTPQPSLVERLRGSEPLWISLAGGVGAQLRCPIRVPLV